MKTLSGNLRRSALLVLSCFAPTGLHAQYIVGPPSPVFLGGAPGDPNNTSFTGPVHTGSAIYTNLNYSGSLYAVGQSATTLAFQRLRLNSETDRAIGTSGVASRGGDPVNFNLTGRSPGFYFFDDGDQLSYEAWTRDVPDPLDPNSGPIQSRIENFAINYVDPVQPSAFESLGSFAPGVFDFSTVMSVDENNPNAADDDSNTDLAIYNAVDHSLIVGSMVNFNEKYREVSAALGPGDYWLVVGRFAVFSDESVQAESRFFFNPEGPNFNVELNGEPLITGASLTRVTNITSRPRIYSFSVSGTSILLGDFNDDGVVDAADYTVWRDNLNSSAAALNGNGSNDPSGLVVQADYDLWKATYEANGASGPAGSASVPEPAACWMLAAATVCGIAGRKRTREVVL